MTIQIVRDRIDNWLAPRWSWLVGKQDTYFSSNGRYFQGLWTHTATVEQDDVVIMDEVPDNLSSKPHDQTHSWHDAVGSAFDSLPFPCRMKIDVYDGPQGHGWIATLQVLYKGDIYIRSKQVGPEIYHTQDWYKYEQPDPTNQSLWQRLFG